MTFSDTQRATLETLDRSGLMINTGEPCDCGDEADYKTTMTVGYSDTAVYKHTCRTCDNYFETWTEG